MSRKANSIEHARADCEAALGALADYAECAERVELRIGQAIRRAGLTALLDPALVDLERMAMDVMDARSQVMSAMQRLME